MMAADRFRIVAYLPEYRALAIDPAVAAAVTDLIFFSVEPTPTGEIDARRLTPEIRTRLAESKKRNPQLRLHIALGGADRSDGFAPMATDAARRDRFVRALVGFCREERFDGVDFDWEFPRNAGESDALASLIVATKRTFAPHGLAVSTAVAPWDRFPRSVLDAVDTLHLMTYFDDSQHTPLALAQKETEDLLRKGADPRKVCMGIPFYGEQVDKKDVTPTYAEIVRQYRPAPEADEANGIAFNGVRTVQQKTRYARRKGLGGVMIWEIGQDTPDGALLRAIRDAAALPAR